MLVILQHNHSFYKFLNNPRAFFQSHAKQANKIKTKPRRADAIKIIFLKRTCLDMSLPSIDPIFEQKNGEKINKQMFCFFILSFLFINFIKFGFIDFFFMKLDYLLKGSRSCPFNKNALGVHSSMNKLQRIYSNNYIYRHLRILLPMLLCKTPNHENQLFVLHQNSYSFVQQSENAHVALIHYGLPTSYRNPYTNLVFM